MIQLIIIFWAEWFSPARYLIIATEKVMKHANLLLPMLAACFLCGCASTKKTSVILKTPEELAAQLKAENPETFAPKTILEDQGAAQMVGEWKCNTLSLCQVDSRYGINVGKHTSEYTYQFFEDGTYHQIYRGQGGVSAVYHGAWSYSNGLMTLHEYKDNILQRQTPWSVVWHSEDIFEMRVEAESAKKDVLMESPQKFYAIDIRYDGDGFQIFTSDSEYARTRSNDTVVTAPWIFKRVGNAVRLSTEAEWQNPVVHTEALDAELEASRLAAEAREREAQAGMAVAEAIVLGATSFSTAVSQSQPIVNQTTTIQPTPVTQPTTTSPTTVPVKPTFKPYQRVSRPSSFFVGENADGSPKVSDQSWRDGRYK